MKVQHVVDEVAPMNFASKQSHPFTLGICLILSAALLCAGCYSGQRTTQAPPIDAPLMKRIILEPPSRPGGPDGIPLSVQIEIPGYVRFEKGRVFRVGEKAGITVDSMRYFRREEWRSAMLEDSRLYGNPQDIAGWQVFTDVKIVEERKIVTVLAYQNLVYTTIWSAYPKNDSQAQARALEVIRCILLSIRVLDSPLPVDQAD